MGSIDARSYIADGWHHRVSATALSQGPTSSYESGPGRGPDAGGRGVGRPDGEVRAAPGGRQDAVDRGRRGIEVERVEAADQRVAAVVVRRRGAGGTGREDGRTRGEMVPDGMA